MGNPLKKLLHWNSLKQVCTILKSAAIAIHYNTDARPGKYNKQLTINRPKVGFSSLSDSLIKAKRINCL